MSCFSLILSANLSADLSAPQTEEQQQGEQHVKQAIKLDQVEGDILCGEILSFHRCWLATMTENEHFIAYNFDQIYSECLTLQKNPRSC